MRRFGAGILALVLAAPVSASDGGPERNAQDAAKKRMREEIAEIKRLQHRAKELQEAVDAGDEAKRREMLDARQLHQETRRKSAQRWRADLLLKIAAEDREPNSIEKGMLWVFAGSLQDADAKLQEARQQLASLPAEKDPAKEPGDTPPPKDPAPEPPPSGKGRDSGRAVGGPSDVELDGIAAVAPPGMKMPPSVQEAMEKRDSSDQLAMAGASVGGSLSGIGADPFGPARDAGDMPDGGFGSKFDSLSARGGGGGPTPTPGWKSPVPANVANPKTTRELMLAAQTGYSGAFRRQGLKFGRSPDGDPIVVDAATGRSATPERLDALKAAIAKEPRALAKRPDFYDILPRSRFQRLKTDYRTPGPERDREFQDIGLTPGDRDFAWDKNCARVSGECNPNMKESSAKKDEDVSPETLKSVYDRIRGLSKKYENKRRELATGKLKGRSLLAKIGARLGGMLGFGDGRAGPAAAGEGRALGEGRASVGEEDAVQVGEYSAGARNASEAGRAPEAARIGPSASAVAPGGPPLPAPGPDEESSGGLWLYLVFGAAGAGIAAFGLRRD